MNRLLVYGSFILLVTVIPVALLIFGGHETVKSWMIGVIYGMAVYYMFKPAFELLREEARLTKEGGLLSKRIELYEAIWKKNEQEKGNVGNTPRG
jgi:Na+/melibiose symporter-like transporter